MKELYINNKEVKGEKFAFNGCHKFYILENDQQEQEAEKFGYQIHIIDDLPALWEKACPLRFISSFDLKIQYVTQFEENVTFNFK